MVRYRGEFVVKDIANGRQYLADLLYQFELGDSLAAPWILGGTAPTIASDGSIRLYDNGAGAGSSQGNIIIPNTLGEFLGILHMKITRKVDDTSVDTYSLYCNLTADASLNSGVVFRNVASLPSVNGGWFNSVPAGVYLTLIAGAMATETEYNVDLIVTQSEVIFIVNGVRVGSTPRSNKGTITALPSHQNQVWRSGQKRVSLYAGHGAGTVTHYRVRDIKVGRLVGVGDV